VLSEWRAYRLLRAVAPAGFGKTTLGVQWFQQMADMPEAERPARAWVALDRTDDAPERFLRRLVDALSPDFPAAADIFTRGLAAEQPPDRILADLLALLGAHPTPIVLLFDDVHRLRETSTMALLQAILDDGPPNLHLALFSRTRPPLQIGRLQLEQTVFGLNARSLSFDHDEFSAFIAGSPLAMLDSEKIARIERRASGWAAGLQILMHAMQPGAGLSPDELYEVDATVTEDFWEYIEHEVLHNLPQREFDFLLDISLLPFLTADLCAAVSGLSRAECERLLRHIAAVNALVNAPSGSDAAHAGRIHAVLREFLLHRLMQHRTPDELQAMRRRAAQHLGKSGEEDAALDMLLPTPEDSAHSEPSLYWLGDDLEAAGDLIEQATRATLLHGELAAVRRWMRKLPESVIRTRPRLAVDNAWVATHHLEPGSDRYLQPVYEALHAAPERTDDALRAEVIIMEALRGLIDGRYAEAWDALQRARSLPIASNSLAAAYRSVCAGFLMYGTRRTLDERIHDMQHAADTFARIGFPRGKIEALCLEASLHRIYADGAGLSASAARARQFMDQIGIEVGAFRINLSHEFGDGLYAMNQIDAARAEYYGLLRIFDQDAPPGATPYIARVRLHLCDLAAAVPLAIDDAADDAADDAEWDSLRRRGYGLTVLNTAFRRIQRDMLRGRPDLCWRTVTSLGILPPDLSTSTPLPHTIAVLAGALFSGRHLEILGPLLTDFRARMDAIGHHSFKLHAHALLVQLHLAQRQPKTALVELRALLADLEPGGFIRIVLDLPLLHPLLPDIDTPFAARLAAMVNATRAAAISPAEQRVLEQFATGGRSADIAASLHLSIETVRSHIKSIYAKLDARTRAQALERARAKGLI
jgi:LuxR family maltose regulon positive regulatory protein